MSPYQHYKALLAGVSYPHAVLDEQALRANAITNLQRAEGVQIRLATKSIRCVQVLRYLLDFSSQFQGLMTFHGEEVLFLLERGFDDLLMGYPIVDRTLIASIANWVEKGKTVCFMIDSPEHLDVLQDVGRQLGVELSVCIDVDVSNQYPGLHFGVWRSQVDDLQSLNELLDALEICSHVRLDGLMSYEAQVAGVVDRGGVSRAKDAVVRLLKRRAISRVSARRAAAVELIQSRGFSLRFVNGGGTGSIESTVAEVAVTEVTVGSGFYAPHLFDKYEQFNLEPALFYGVQIVRQPRPDVYTCHGGGFVASGAADGTKEPEVHLPESGYLDDLEGAGEVQTPVRFHDLRENLRIGDPVYLRHAKAGELCERFNVLHFLQTDGQRRELLTYRGDGASFG